MKNVLRVMTVVIALIFCLSTLNAIALAEIPSDLFTVGEQELPFMLGDVNEDGKVNSSDARLTLRIAAKIEKAEQDSAAFFAADVDGNGKITSADARTILRVAAKLERFPDGEDAVRPITDAAFDQDGNGVLDCIENEDRETDTDGDGISDYDEFVYTNTDPATVDSDGDGVGDLDEDTDGDGLSNSRELLLETDPASADSDNDGLTDSEELDGYHTDPTKPDTDDDGAADAWEIGRGTDPTVYDESFSVYEECEADGMTATVELTAVGAVAETVSIAPVEEHILIDETIPGYLGSAFEFNADGAFGIAKVSFVFDPESLAADARPTIYCLNEETQTWYEFETIVDGNTATAQSTHFSKYILIDKNVYERYLNDIRDIDFSEDTGVDSNRDGITDFVTKLMCDGVIRTGTGTMVFGDYTYEQVQLDDDLDGDGLKNGDEIKTDLILDIPEDAAEYQGHYYKVFNIGHVWDDAEAYCESIGGYLATVTSAEENDLIYGLIQNEPKNVYWLGGSLYGDAWHWVTGEAWEYTNWGKNKPDNYNECCEDRCQMYRVEYNSNPVGTWNDAAYNGAGYHSTYYELSYTGFVCEWGTYFAESHNYTFVNSSPIYKDTDRDGIPDIDDTAPTERGLKDGIVGAMKIVSYSDGPSSIGRALKGSGHAFISYTSYIKDTVFLYGVNITSAEKTVQSKKDNSWVSSGSFRLNAIDLGPNEVVTIGTWAGWLDKEQRGIYINNEKYICEPYVNIEGQYSLTKYMTEEDVSKLEKCTCLESYWNVVMNCSWFAGITWNVLTGDDLSPIGLYPNPSTLSYNISLRDDHEYEIPFLAARP